AALLASVDAVAARADTHLMARDGRVFSMVIEHELMHQETLLYMLQRLPFDWDNEFSALEVHVPAFRIDGTPVTNGQFQAFVEDGGYTRADLWIDEDWVWRGHDGVGHPAVWELVDGAWV